MKIRPHPFVAGPPTRRHRPVSPGRRLVLERLEGRWVPSAIGGAAPRAAITSSTLNEPGLDIVSIKNTGPVLAGTPVTVSVLAFSNTGAADVLTYAFDDFDDGTFETSNTSGVASVTYDLPGLYRLRVHVTDSRDGTQVDAFTTIDAMDAPPTLTAPGDQSAAEGASTSFDLGSFSDLVVTSPWSVTVDWGDGTPPAKFTAPAPGDLGSLPHTFARYGTYPVTITVDDGHVTGTATFRAGVRDVTPTLTPTTPQVAVEGSAASFDPGRFIDPGTDAPWSVTVDWGDGSPPASFSVSTAGDLGLLTHDYARYGTYPVAIRVDDGRATAYAASGVKVLDVPPSVSPASDQEAIPGDRMSVALGGFTDPGADAPWVVTVDWGDGTPPSSFDVSTPGDLGSLAHVFAAKGAYPVTVAVGDGLDSNSATFHVDALTPIETGPQTFQTAGSVTVPPPIIVPLAPQPPPPPALPVPGAFGTIDLLADLTIVAVGLPVPPTGQGGTPSAPPGGFQARGPITQGLLSGTISLSIFTTPPSPPAATPGGVPAVAAPALAGAPAAASTAPAANVAAPVNAVATAPPSQGAGGATSSTVVRSSAAPAVPADRGRAMSTAIMLVALVSHQKRERFRLKGNLFSRGGRPGSPA